MRVFLLLLVIAFPVSEITLAIIKRAGPDAAQVEDRGSMRLLWLTIVAAVVLAIVFRWFSAGWLSIPPLLGQVLAITCLACGLAIRWTSIFALGRLFTVDVAVQQGHTVVQSGMYKYIRHPSYAGLLLTFVGLGLYFANWLSLAVLILPITLAVANRIAKEESVLRAALGNPYADYCARTKRIIPGIV